MGKPLLDVLRDVVLDPAEQAAFTADPAVYLAEYGYDDVTPDDLSEAFGLVADTLPPDVAQAVAAAAPPPPAPAPDLDEGFAVGEGDGATFGEVNGDFDGDLDPVGLGGPDTTPDPDLDEGEGDRDLLFDEGDTDGQPSPEGDRPAAFGEGVGDDLDPDRAGFDPDPDPDFGGDLAVDAAAELPVDVEVEVEGGWADEPGDDYTDDGLGGPDTFPADDDGSLGDDPSDFIDDVGSF